jgi:hypothetical protein
MPQEAAPAVIAASAPSGLFLGDSFTVQAARELPHAVGFRDRFRLRIELANARRWERRWYRKADAIACVSPADAEILATLTGRPVGLIPIAIGEEWFSPPDRPRSRSLVTVVGALDYWPNIDGVVCFESLVPAQRVR